MEWISVKDRLPSKEECNGMEYGSFLCFVIIPESGGTYTATQNVLDFSVMLKDWDCEGCIVTHWMELPDYPKEGGFI